MSKKYEFQHNIIEVAPLVKMHMQYLSTSISKKAAIWCSNQNTMEETTQIQCKNALEEVDHIVKEYIKDMNHTKHQDFEFAIQFNLKSEPDADEYDDLDEFCNYGIAVKHVGNCLKFYYCGCYFGNDYKKLAFSISVSLMETKKHISHFLAWSSHARALIVSKKIQHIEITKPEM